MIAALGALLAPYVLRLAVAGGLLLAGVAGFFTLKIHYEHAGYQRAIAAIAAKDKEAVDAADASRERVRACRNSGGLWDTADGVCRGR
jgi:hypothetical protein